MQNTFKGKFPHIRVVLQSSNASKFYITQVTRNLRILDEFGNEILNFRITSREIVEVVRKLLSVFDTERVSSVVLRIESGLSVCQTNVVSE